MANYGNGIISNYSFEEVGNSKEKGKQCKLPLHYLIQMYSCPQCTVKYCQSSKFANSQTCNLSIPRETFSIVNCSTSLLSAHKMFLVINH